MSDDVTFTRILRANAAYAEAIDGGDLDAWVTSFTPDGWYLAQPRENFDRGLPLATIRCEGRGMLEDRVLAIRKTMVFAPRYVRHIIAAPHMLNGADSVTNFVVYQTLAMQPTQVLATGVYRDTWAEVNGTLKLRSRLAVFDSELVPNSIIYPL
jgi:salicylate 5-hydroxylase small subunit